MSDDTTKIEFLQYQQTPLDAGEYEIEVEQDFAITGHADPRFPKTAARFTIQGARFELAPTDLFAVFPPPSSLGSHAHILPHVVLTRSTLPWERSALPSDDPLAQETPWLALLVFDETELSIDDTGPNAALRVITLKDLRAAGGPAFPRIQLETGQEPDDRVMVVDLPRRLLEAVMPTRDDLALLAHVRRATDDGELVDGIERATVIANRLPRADALSTALLVSVEGRYDGDGFRFGGIAADQTVRLIVLKQWQFSCEPRGRNFRLLVEQLDRRPPTLRLPDVAPEGEADRNAVATANDRLRQGAVPLPHYMRQGSESYAWYHGPLSPAKSSARLDRSIRSQDELLRYNRNEGLFDVAYAAAWQLGQLLMLQDQSLSVRQYQWKRSRHQARLAADQDTEGLPAAAGAAAEPVPEKIRERFTALSLLEGVPFPYLVPDERLLPKESIRFFTVDLYWVDCLLDGAFSVGRVRRNDARLDEKLRDEVQRDRAIELSGCLIRSEVVAGWPGLQIEAFRDEAPLALKRRAALSDNVLLCLFAGELDRLDVFVQLETLHFGVDEDAENKMLRSANGQVLESTVKVPFRSARAQRVVDVSALAQRLIASDPRTSAQFAFAIMEGYDKVQLLRAKRR